MTPIAPDTSTRNLARAFTALVCATYALIVLGALVRAQGAGLACPDWPLCFGEFVPRFDLKVAFEWGHRVWASVVSIIFVTLALLAWRDTGRRKRVGRLLYIAAGLLALQVLLGALTVWKLLAAWSVTSHLLTGNAFAACLVLITAGLFDIATPRSRPSQHPAGLRAAVSFAGVLLVGQVALGGLVASKYAGLVCQEWPTCNEGEWFPGFAGALGLQIGHRLLAYALALAICTCAVLGRGPTRLARLLQLALGLVAAQIAVGVANVLLRLPVEVTGAHSALAAMLIAVTTLALREVWWDGGALLGGDSRDVPVPQPGAASAG